MDANPIPAGDFKLAHPTAKGPSEDEQQWTYLDRNEQLRVLSCEEITMARRVVYCVALYTGARLSELKAVQWQDLRLDDDAPSWRLCRGRRGRTKNDRVRTFDLLPVAATDRAPAHLANAITALRWWRDNGKVSTKPCALVFPGRNGSERHEKHDFGWRDKPRFVKTKKAIREGTTRRVTLGSCSTALGPGHAATFHSLRHTTASALISGMWGRAWSPTEIQTWMGWQQASMVDRYAHLTRSKMAEAVAATKGALPAFGPRAPLSDSGSLAALRNDVSFQALETERANGLEPSTSTLGIERVTGNAYE